MHIRIYAHMYIYICTNIRRYRLSLFFFPLFIYTISERILTSRDVAINESELASCDIPTGDRQSGGFASSSFTGQSVKGQTGISDSTVLWSDCPYVKIPLRRYHESSTCNIIERYIDLLIYKYMYFNYYMTRKYNV